jgi:hypothetical protein
VVRICVSRSYADQREVLPIGDYGGMFGSLTEILGAPLHHTKLLTFLWAV